MRGIVAALAACALLAPQVAGAREVGLKLDPARPFSSDTQVQAFSMTRPVTGVALMQSWEQGKFGLDDPLSRYLPRFAG